jgi:hypothetical protein
MKATDKFRSVDDFRVAILRQRTRLAQGIDELEAQSRAALSDGERAPLHRALTAFAKQFVGHLEFEEQVLTVRPTLLQEQASWLSEGGEQLRRVRGLMHDRDVFEDVRTLAREALVVVHHLRKELAEEEVRIRELH